MLRLIARSLVALLVLVCGPAQAILHGSIGGALSNVALTTMNLGGGGNVSGGNFVSGVKFARGDVFGAYVFGTDNTWHLISGESNMCPGGYPCPYFGFYPANTSANQAYVGFSGIIDLVGCPGVSSCAYMYGGGWVFYSSNISASNPSAITWCSTNFVKTSDTSNSAVAAGDPGPFMAVDPNNPDHVLVGTSATGIFESFNATQACAGTDTWAAISTSSIPQATSYAGYIVAFDPTSPTATCKSGSGTCTSTVYVYTNGATAGVYATFNAEASWALTSSGPSTVKHMKVSAATAGGGNVWVDDTSSILWEYNNASGAACSTSSGTCSWQTGFAGVTGVADVAINPLNGNHIAVSGGSKIYTSSNGSSAVPSFTARSGSNVAGDSPWSVLTNIGASEVFLHWMDFDPLNNDVIIGGGEQWVWTTSFPTGAYTLAALSSGIQGAVSFGNIAVGAAQAPSFGFEDITGCAFTIASASSPAQNCMPPGSIATLFYYSGLSVAPGTSFMAAKGSEDFNSAFDLSGYSTDGFKTTYLPYNTWNATINSSSLSTGNTVGQPVVLTVPSTASLNSFSPGQTLSSLSIVCTITSYVGAALNQVCFPITVLSATTIQLIGSTYATAMAASGHTYTVYVPAVALDDQFGTGAIFNVTSASGVIEITARFGISASQTVACITGVVMTGASVVNGCWAATKVSNTVFKLIGSTFAGGDAYSTGGVVSAILAPGGSVAAASSSNFALYGANGTLPGYCTANAGASWNQISIAGIPAAVTTVTGGPYSAGTTSITVANGGVLTSAPKLLLASGRYLDESGSSVAGTTVTLAYAIPQGDSLATGAPVYGQQSGGGPFAAYLRSHQIAADQVTPNTFYYMNDQVGLVKWTNCGSTTIVAPETYNTGFLADPDNDQLKAVPGQAGHLFFTTGSSGSTHPASNQLWRTCNGVNSSVTLTSVPGFYEPIAVGFGKIAPGQSYPSIYVVGWYSATNTRATATYGIWRSLNDANNGSTGSCAGGNTWTEISGTNGFPAGFPTGIKDIEGDPFVYAPYYVLGSFGQFYGVQNFLLKRDIDPASNDNDPAWTTSKAA